MVELHIKNWTDEEKQQMAKVATDIIELMEKEFGKGKFAMMLNTLNVLTNSVSDELAVERFDVLDKDGNSQKHEKLKRARQIIEGMQKSHINLVLFRNPDSEIWFQIHIGIYLEKDNYVISTQEDYKKHEKEFSLLQEQSRYMKKVFFISEWNNEEIDRAVQCILMEVTENAKKP